MRSLFATVAVLLTGCWNFDEAYAQFCDGGRCPEAVRDAGGVHDAGPSADGGRADSGVAVADAGPRDAGTLPDSGAEEPAPDSGPTSPADAGQGAQNDAGPVDAGAPPDAGMPGDAGPPPCLGFGEQCTSFACCAVSDAGIRMACARNNLCQEYAPDCKESGFDCTSPDECCGQRCVAGRCALCLGQGQGTCNKATDCCPGYSCAADHLCTYAGTGMEVGDRCPTASYCGQSGTPIFCDGRDAGLNDGVCSLAVGCAGLGEPNGACCSGLDAGPSGCCLELDRWCLFSSDCCSGNCIGNRCTDKSYADIGERCFSGSQCAGPTTICNPIGLTCTTRICLPQGANPFAGCCTVSPGELCRFGDGTSCLVFGASTNDIARCCSGNATGTFPNFTCREVAFF